MPVLANELKSKTVIDGSLSGRLVVSEIKCYKWKPWLNNLTRHKSHILLTSHNAKCCDSINFDAKNPQRDTWSEEKVTMRCRDIKYVDRKHEMSHKTTVEMQTYRNYSFIIVSICQHCGIRSIKKTGSKWVLGIKWKWKYVLIEARKLKSICYVHIIWIQFKWLHRNYCASEKKANIATLFPIEWNGKIHT